MPQFYRRKQILIQPVFAVEVIEEQDNLPEWVAQALEKGTITVHRSNFNEEKFLYIRSTQQEELKFIKNDNVIWEENGKILCETSLGFTTLFEQVIPNEPIKIVREKTDQDELSV